MANQQKVAEAYIELQLRLAQFKQSVGEAEGEINRFQQGMRRQMQQSQASVRLVSEELGLHMPRALQSFVSKLPGVATAMNAAFNAVAVFALIGIVVQAGERISEFVSKNREAARKNAEAWRGINQPLLESNDTMRVANDRLQEAIDKLQHKPSNGIKLAIDEAVLSADKLSGKLTEDLDKLAQTLRSSSPGILSQVLGEAGTGDISNRFAAYQARLMPLDQRGQAAVHAAQNGPGSDADRKGAVDKARKDWADAVTPILREGAKAFSDELQKSLGSDASQRRNAASIGLDPNKLNTGMASRIEALSGLVASFNGQIEAHGLQQNGENLQGKLDRLTAASQASADLLRKFEQQEQAWKLQYGSDLMQESNFWNSKLSAFTKGSDQYKAVLEKYVAARDAIFKHAFDVQRQANANSGAAPSMTPNGSMDGDNSAIAKGKEQQAAFNEEWTLTSIKLREAQGAITANDAATLTAATHAEAYRVKLEALNEQLAKLKAEDMTVNGQPVDPNNARKQQDLANQIAALQNQGKLQSFQDAQAELGTTWRGMIDSVFEEIIAKAQNTTAQLKQISQEFISAANDNIAKLMTGQHTDWHKTFQNSGEQLARTSLGKVEGMGLSMLGFGGGKRDGSAQGKALWVQMAGGPDLSMFKHSMPNVTGPGGGGMAASASKGLLGMLNDSNWASSLMGGKLFGAGSIFGGGFAMGGDVQAGVPINVGEMGIERFTPSVPGHITPNKDMQGGDTYHVVVNGGDPVQTRDAVRQGVAAARAQSNHDMKRMADRAARRPQG